MAENLDSSESMDDKREIDTSVDDNDFSSDDTSLDEKDFIGLDITKLNPCPNIGSAGFIVIDLETDGLIKKHGGVVSVPSITQVAFGPLEMRPSKAFITDFYVQNSNFNTQLAKTDFFKERFIRYDDKEECYILKPDTKRKAVPFQTVTDYMVKWKNSLYGECKPVFLVAHNADGFDKIVFERQLRMLDIFDDFKRDMNLSGWIDSLHLIRNLPCVAHVLKYPNARLPHSMNKPFSLPSLVKQLNLKRPNGEPFVLHFAENDVEALIRIMRDLNFHKLLAQTIIVYP